MITALNRLVDLVEERLTEEIDVAGLALSLGTTEYHVRRMFSSLAGMPVSEYVRRRRMTVASAAPSGRSTAPAPATYDVTAAPFVHNHSSGSA